jgi:hypothetical protein
VAFMRATALGRIVLLNGEGLMIYEFVEPS